MSNMKSEAKAGASAANRTGGLDSLAPPHGKRGSLREALLNTVIRQSNNVSIDTLEEEDEDSEMKGSKLLDLTEDENTKFLETHFVSKMDFTPLEERVEGWRFLAQQILNPISSWQNALTKLKDRKRANIEAKSKLPPVGFLRQATRGFSRRPSLSPADDTNFLLTRRGGAAIAPLPKHILKTFESEGMMGAKVIQLENDIEELEDDHKHAVQVFKNMKLEAQKLLRRDRSPNKSSLPGFPLPEQADQGPRSTFYAQRNKSVDLTTAEPAVKKPRPVLMVRESPQLLQRVKHQSKNFIVMNRRVVKSRASSPKRREQQVGAGAEAQKQLPSLSELRKRIPKIYGRKNQRVHIDCAKLGSKSTGKLGGWVTPLQVRERGSQPRRGVGAGAGGMKCEVEWRAEGLVRDFQSAMSARSERSSGLIII